MSREIIFEEILHKMVVVFARVQRVNLLLLMLYSILVSNHFRNMFLMYQIQHPEEEKKMIMYTKSIK